MKITSKEKSYELYEDGAFGNKLRTWGDVRLLLLDDYGGNVTMRYASKYGKWCSYNINQDDLCDEIDRWVKDGADRKLIRFNESAPDERLVIQGEFCEDGDHKYILSYSTDKVKMREAMRFPKEILGDNARAYLTSLMSPASATNLKRLLNTYPGAVVEFSVYDHHLGNIPLNNTVFWEARNY